MKKVILISFGVAQLAIAGNVTGHSVGGYVNFGAWTIPAWNTTYDSCSPEVKQTNIAMTDTVLQGLVQNELKHATTFKTLVQQASALNESERVQAYLGIMGVENDYDIANLIGSRQVNAKYIYSLSKNANLKPEEAQIVLERVSKSLLGERH